MEIKAIPTKVVNNTDLEKYLKLQLRVLHEEITSQVDEEITNKDLIQFKGYIDIKSIFTLKLDKFKKFLDTDKTLKKIDQFVKKYVFGGIENLEKDLGVNLLGVKFTTNKLKDSKSYKILKESMMENVKNINDRLIDKLKSQIFQGVINGESLTSINKRINKTFSKEYDYTETMARTEAANLINQGEFMAAKESGLKLRKYLSVHHDNRTSSICKELGMKYGDEEQSIPIHQKFKWNVSKGGEKLKPGFHPNCRTSLMWVQE